ncbi:hypothetical protein BB560_004867 [Smittium megazygosporum]|uniref:Uncharacterized protein n=1 Tax=Smittium megazygosporum TaxID=133381 RepID=A0A2T9Z817_9FUNG|nr:hypothetical protein BB560_004867 [Smittium megazygosporum]
MAQSTVLNEIDLSFSVASLMAGQDPISYPLAARLSQQKVESVIDIIESELPPDLPPKYTTENFVLSDNEKEALGDLSSQTLNDQKRNSIPPVYTEAKPMFLPAAFTQCVSCNDKTRYFGALADSRNWTSVAFQFVSFILSLVALPIVFALVTFSLGLLVIFPIGTIIAWSSFVVIRAISSLELNTLQMTNTSAKLCQNCNPTSPATYSVPPLPQYSNSSFFSKLLSILRDAYAWRCIGYFMFVKPIVSFVSFSFSITSLVTGVILFPLLPVVLRFISKLSCLQKKIAVSVLNPRSK